LGQCALRVVGVETELLVDLVATDLGQVVSLRVEVEVLQQRLGRLLRGRLTGAQLAVDVQQRVVGTRGGVLLERVAHGLVLAEALQDLVGGPTEGLEQDGDALLALPVDADTDEVTLVDLELQPRSEERRVGTACRSRRSAGREYGA